MEVEEDQLQAPGLPLVIESLLTAKTSGCRTPQIPICPKESPHLIVITLHMTVIGHLMTKGHLMITIVDLHMIPKILTDLQDLMPLMPCLVVSVNYHTAYLQFAFKYFIYAYLYSLLWTAFSSLV